MRPDLAAFLGAADRAFNKDREKEPGAHRQDNSISPRRRYWSAAFVYTCCGRFDACQCEEE